MPTAFRVAGIGQRRRRHHPMAVAGRGRQPAVISHQHVPRPRDQRAQPFDQRQRLEHHALAAIAPGFEVMLTFVCDPWLDAPRVGRHLDRRRRSHSMNRAV
jgi:hypothetical protein